MFKLKNFSSTFIYSVLSNLYLANLSFRIGKNSNRLGHAELKYAVKVYYYLLQFVAGRRITHAVICPL